MRLHTLASITGSVLVCFGTLIGCGASDDAASGIAGGASGGTPGTPTAGAGSTLAGAPSTVGGSTNGGSSGASQAGAAGAPLATAGAGGAAAGAGGMGGALGSAGSTGSAGSGGSTGIPAMKNVGYLPNYRGSYASWAAKLDFRTMTHLNLAFTLWDDAKSDWSMGASDADVKVLVDKAHAAGVKVLASLGGGGGDRSVFEHYATASNIDPMVAKASALVTRLNLDGVDVDIENAQALSKQSNFDQFVAKLMTTFHPNKLVTTAIAQYLLDDSKAYGGFSTVTLNSWDFINVMIYEDDYNTYVGLMKWWTDTQKYPKEKLTVGVPFFGKYSNGNDYAEYDYKAIMAADSSAWSKNQAQVSGRTVHYAGVALITQLATFSRGYGGIMNWEMSADTTDEHSLWKAIQAQY